MGCCSSCCCCCGCSIGCLKYGDCLMMVNVLVVVVIIGVVVVEVVIGIVEMVGGGVPSDNLMVDALDSIDSLEDAESL